MRTGRAFALSSGNSLHTIENKHDGDAYQIDTRQRWERMRTVTSQEKMSWVDALFEKQVTYAFACDSGTHRAMRSHGLGECKALEGQLRSSTPLDDGYRKDCSVRPGASGRCKTAVDASPFPGAPFLGYCDLRVEWLRKLSGVHPSWHRRGVGIIASPLGVFPRIEGAGGVMTQAAPHHSARGAFFFERV